MKEKTIPVYFRSYSTRYYLTHPWKYFHDIRVSIKNLWHRMRCGYAWVDLWNMDNYLDNLIPNMLEELANRSHGWPEGPEWPEFEDWQAEIRVMAMLWRIQGRDLVVDDDLFEQDFSAYEDGRLLEPIKHLPGYEKYLLTEEDKTAIAEPGENKWLRVDTKARILREKLFARLAYMWPTLWD